MTYQKLSLLRAHIINKYKPVGAICHGPQILLSAGLLSGRNATCYKSVAPKMKDGGVNYDDREIVVDGNIVTSRRPGDLPAFMRGIIKLVNNKGNLLQ